MKANLTADDARDLFNKATGLSKNLQYVENLIMKAASDKKRKVVVEQGRFDGVIGDALTDAGFSRTVYRKWDKHLNEYKWYIEIGW